MRILIVDDEAPLRQSLGLLLSESGYSVESEGNPARALARAEAEAFDLILCDVRMPEMDGLTFLRRYRGAGGSALIVMMSAYGNEDAAIEAMREGAYDYLAKPFRPDEVVLTVRKAAERERLAREVATLRAAVGAEAIKEDVIAESRQMRNLLELAARTGEAGYWQWYDRIWDYSWTHFVDHAHGAWYRILGPDNRKLTDEKSPAGKTDYHTMGACYEVLKVV